MARRILTLSSLLPLVLSVGGCASVQQPKLVLVADSTGRLALTKLKPRRCHPGSVLGIVSEELVRPGYDGPRVTTRRWSALRLKSQIEIYTRILHTAAHVQLLYEQSVPTETIVAHAEDLACRLGFEAFYLTAKRRAGYERAIRVDLLMRVGTHDPITPHKN